MWSTPCFDFSSELLLSLPFPPLSSERREESSFFILADFDILDVLGCSTSSSGRTQQFKRARMATHST